MTESPVVIPTILAITSLSFLPFIVVMGTAFTKISIVLMLLRNALGVQQAPSGIVINSIALSLTLFIMLPVGDEILSELRSEHAGFYDWESAERAFNIVASVFSDYLLKFTNGRELNFFIDAAHSIWPESYHTHATKDNIFILLPAHVSSEIARAFEIAFLIFLPFVVIDMIVSNVLLAMGAMMVPPMLISLPIKILLFVSIDGWSKLLHGLILSYS
ncbi:type III secretion system export apparatus subunit SctR [Ruegeria sp. SCPT10]|uniref:type III secretion system export apparatus subunit SctR n=1 Tax=Ruegeria sp. SCP10 TaxID=3141377 RepID=UPI00333A6A06